ncbi:MAG TPA: NADP-dependent oxidoreductase [Flavobacterium sp.]|nr:NADP-dependent oxidoreductase [Flavobacterium sp.]
MDAYVLKEAGSVEQLQIENLEKPTPSADEVLIKVKALSINPVDIKTRLGKSMYANLRENFETIILGWDVSGIVESVGSDVTGFKPGDAVFGMINFPGHGKAYAEYVAAPASHLALKPSNISHEEAAAATLAALTAYQILSRHLKPGDKILIHAAAGGVGHFAVQIAKILGAHVTATVSEKNIAFAKSLGADEIVDYTKQPFENVAKNLDFVLDTLSGETLERTIQTVRKGGTIITIPSAGFNEEIVAKGKAHQVTIGFEMVASNGNDMKQIAQWLKSGQLKAEVSQVFPFDKLRDAHTQIESGRTRGKVVVII